MGIDRHRITYGVKRPGFALTELLIVLSAGGALLVLPQFSWLPLALILGIWFLRILTGQFLSVVPLLDILMGFFLLSAGIAVWSAYDFAYALRKFWILFSAVALFYALSRQPVNHRHFVWGLMAAAPVLYASYFMITHDWQNAPVKFGLISNIGEAWMAVRPQSSLPVLHPNRAAGLIGLHLPYLFAFLLREWHRKKRYRFGLFLAGFLFSALGVLLTASRGSWIALLFAFGIWLLLSRGKKLIGSVRWAEIFMLVAIPVGAILVSLALILNGQESGIDRLELFRQSGFLAFDFPMRGAGLGSFAGLFSRYIRVIPFFFFSNGHNIFLDIAVEQGVIGLIAFSGIVAITISMLLPAKVREVRLSEGLLSYAVLASIIFMSLHGLVTDTLYAERALPLLFAFAGITVMLHREPLMSQKNGSASFLLCNPAVKRYIAIFGLLGLGVMIYLGYRPMASIWIANNAAIDMAKIELSDFPRRTWEEGEKLGDLQKLKTEFQKALVLDHGNLTANYRLGLLHMAENDYSIAADYLELAYESAPHHRGILKSLGYCYVWLGRYSEAVSLLKDIPEAEEEINSYVWWWQTQSQEELSIRAQQMVMYFDSKEMQP